MQFRFAVSRNMPCRFATRGWRKTEKSQESAKVPAVGHKCPNYLAVGIRSTAIIWTATPKSRWPSKFAGRTRERAFSPPPSRPPRCPNSHSDAPNYLLLRTPSENPLLLFVTLRRANQFRSPCFSRTNS